MSNTIDQQRQRVEQEMTRMVDDVDKTFLRNLQVIWVLVPKVSVPDKVTAFDIWLLHRYNVLTFLLHKQNQNKSFACE